MMRKKLIATVCILLLSLSACGKQESKKTENSNRETLQPVQTEDGSRESFQPVRTEEASPVTSAEETRELSDAELLRRFHQKFYGVDVPGNEEMEILSGDRARMNLHSKYDSDINYYWEQILGVTDVTSALDPLFYTDMRYYTAEEFENLPPAVIHIAKNEIYAKHGYIFKDEDLNQYFLGCAWYQPRVTSEEFDDSIFNQYERENLKLLAKLDK